MRTSVLAAVVCLQAFLTTCGGADVSNGFNRSLPWKSYTALKNLAGNDKVIMYLFNQPWCGACKRLKEDFEANGEKLLELADSFLMINVGGDDNNKFDATYAPDGGYIPRILFAEPNGKVRADIRNPGAGDKYSYFYTSVDQIKAVMQIALKQLSGSATPQTSEL